MNWRLFEHYINQIDDKNIKTFTITVLDKVDPILEKIPASSTGKHHHRDSHGEGGLVRHILRACYFANIYFEALNWKEPNVNKDILISALLLHDIEKKEKYTKYIDYLNHSVRAVEFIKPYMHLIKNDNISEIISNCVLYHSGPFTPQWIAKPIEKYTQLELLTYFCDYFSMRKEIDINPVQETI